MSHGVVDTLRADSPPDEILSLLTSLLNAAKPNHRVDEVIDPKGFYPWASFVERLGLSERTQEALLRSLRPDPEFLEFKHGKWLYGHTGIKHLQQLQEQ